MPKLYYLIGIPGAGKTTWARTFCKETGAIHCSADEVRAELFGGYDREQTADVHAILRERMLWELCKGNDVVYDSMGVYEFRSQTIEFFKHFAECIAVYFPVTLEEALLGNSQRERKAPEEFVRWSYILNVPPSAEEGFSKIITIYR